MDLSSPPVLPIDLRLYTYLVDFLLRILFESSLKFGDLPFNILLDLFHLCISLILRLFDLFVHFALFLQKLLNLPVHLYFTTC